MGGTGSLALQGVAVTATYLAAALAGFELAFVAEQVTTVWAPTGIAIAALLLFGSRFWPAIWTGAFVANASTDAPLWTAAFIAAGNTLEAVAAVWALRKVPSFTPRLARVADVVAFVLIAAAGCTIISATIGVGVLCAAGVQPWDRFATLWWSWWFGDALGAVIVAPAVLTTAGNRLTRRALVRASLFVAAAFAVTHVAFGVLPLSPHPLEYIIFPLVIVAAVSGGPAITALTVLTASAVAIWHTVNGAGPFSGADIHTNLILLQVFMGVLAGTALLLSAAVAERLVSEQRARDAAEVLSHREEMLRLAQRAGGVATFEWDFRRQTAQCSDEFFRIFGVPGRDGVITAAEWEQLVHPEDRERMAAHLARAIQGLEPASADYRIVAADGTTRWLTYAGRLQNTAEGERMAGTVVDISDRKRLELQLRHHAEEGERANRQLARRIAEQQTLLDVLPIGIGIAMDRECRTIRTNRAFAETLGLSPDTNASKTAPDSERPTNFRIFRPDGSEVPDHDLPMQVAAREGRDVRELEMDVVHDDGRVVRLLEYAAPLLDEHGTPSGAVGAFVDVTAIHRTRATLTRSEARYRRIFETATVSLWEEDFGAIRVEIDRLRQSGIDDVETYIQTHPEFVARCVRLLRIVDVNRATVRLFGAADKDGLTQSLDVVFRPGSEAVFGQLLRALVRGERQYDVEAELQTLDGRRLDVLISVAFPAPGEPLDTVLVSLSDITDRKQAENALRQEMDVRTTLARVGQSLAGELRSEQLIQAVTDASTKLTEAEFGAFFYNVTDDSGDALQLYSLAGAPREAFAQLPHPRATRVFGPTFRGEGIIRLDDVTKDPRYGQNAPYTGMPQGHLPVRSYLAVPVIGRGGDVLGGLFFGHSQPGVFTERHEQLASGVAGWAAIAIDNARLFQDAEEANRLKDEFLATLSHELRTPLNAVLGWAHMLRQSTMQPALQQRALESLERNARAQAQLVEDLLDVSRIMAGKLQVKGDAVDLAMVVTNAVDTVRAGVTAKGLNLNLHLPADRRMLVTGDADRLQQVVWNLVSNAVKFTPAGGRVDVELQSVDGNAEVVVRDTGQGIDPSFRPFLFQRFRQMDASKTRVHGGLGLGLSIVRHLVEAHGGTVAVDSDGAGLGSTFRVLLPLRSVEESERKRVETVQVSAALPLVGLRVLVVDDEADARELTRYLLEARGASVMTSGSAGEALHLLAETGFDILVADIGMPDQDGFALIRAVRGLPEQSPNRHLPAIALTAYAGVRERDEALAAGFSAHLGKPVDPDQLIFTVSACAARDSQP